MARDSGRCGHNYQGRAVTKSKKRKDGSKARNEYYACGAWVMKGNAACEKLLLKKAPLEDVVLEAIQDRVQALVAGEGEQILRKYIDEEIAAQGADPRREAASIRQKIAALDEKASSLLDCVSPDTKTFIDQKLRELASEKSRLTRQLEELESKPCEPIDADLVLQEGLAAINDLPKLMEAGTLEERKEFVRAFVSSVKIDPEQKEIVLEMKKLPALGPGDSTCLMVAGGGFEPPTFGL